MCLFLYNGSSFGKTIVTLRRKWIRMITMKRTLFVVIDRKTKHFSVRTTEVLRYLPLREISMLQGDQYGLEENILRLHRDEVRSCWSIP